MNELLFGWRNSFPPDMPFSNSNNSVIKDGIASRGITYFHCLRCEFESSDSIHLQVRRSTLLFRHGFCIHWVYCVYHTQGAFQCWNCGRGCRCCWPALGASEWYVPVLSSQRKKERKKMLILIDLRSCGLIEWSASTYLLNRGDTNRRFVPRETEDRHDDHS